MSTQNEEPNMYEFQSFDPFPQPQTFPSGWDLSEILSAPKDDSAMETDDSTESESN